MRDDFPLMIGAVVSGPCVAGHFTHLLYQKWTKTKTHSDLVISSQSMEWRGREFQVSPPPSYIQMLLTLVRRHIIDGRSESPQLSCEIPGSCSSIFYAHFMYIHLHLVCYSELNSEVLALHAVASERLENMKDCLLEEQGPWTLKLMGLFMLSPIMPK